MTYQKPPVSKEKMFVVIGIGLSLLALYFLYVSISSQPHTPPPGTVYTAGEYQVYLDVIQRQQEKADTYQLMALISCIIGVILIVFGLVPWPHEGVNYKKKYETEPVFDVNCHNCGAVIPSDSNICQECGHILSLGNSRSYIHTETDVGTLCPHCNNVVHASSKFCGRCGGKLPEP